MRKMWKRREKAERGEVGKQTENFRHTHVHAALGDANVRYIVNVRNSV